MTVNGQPVEVADGCTLAEVISARLAGDRGVAAAVDETVVPRAEWPAIVLDPGQRIELIAAYRARVKIVNLVVPGGDHTSRTADGRRLSPPR